MARSNTKSLVEAYHEVSYDTNYVAFYDDGTIRAALSRAEGPFVMDVDVYAVDDDMQRGLDDSYDEMGDLYDEVTGSEPAGTVSVEFSEDDDIPQPGEFNESSVSLYYVP